MGSQKKRKQPGSTPTLGRRPTGTRQQGRGWHRVEILTAVLGVMAAEGKGEGW